MQLKKSIQEKIKKNYPRRICFENDSFLIRRHKKSLASIRNTRSHNFDDSFSNYFVFELIDHVFLRGQLQQTQNQSEIVHQ